MGVLGALAEGASYPWEYFPEGKEEASLLERRCKGKAAYAGSFAHATMGQVILGSPETIANISHGKLDGRQPPRPSREEGLGSQETPEKLPRRQLRRVVQCLFAEREMRLLLLVAVGTGREREESEINKHRSMLA